MYPILFTIGGIQVFTYGMFFGLGFFVALMLLRAHGEREGLDPDDLTDLVVWLFVSGFLGARLMYVLTNLQQFTHDPGGMFRVWEGGLVFYGGALLGLPTAIYFLRRRKIPMWKAGDAIVPALALGHAIGRLGCVGAGCCHGLPTDLPWGIRLNSEHVEAALRGIPLHPTQLYESAGLVVLFFGLLWVRKHRKFAGQVSLTYFTAYPILRALVEEFRGDSIRGHFIWPWLSSGRVLSILMFTIAMVAMVRLARRHA
jgi:phosphatidylglycerol:prolipoprotein diacylglycerol transferase